MTDKEIDHRDPYLLFIHDLGTKALKEIPPNDQSDLMSELGATLSFYGRWLKIAMAHQAHRGVK